MQADSIMPLFARQALGVDKKKSLPCLKLRREATTESRITTFEHEERDFGRSALRRTTYARDFDTTVSYPTSQPQKDEAQRHRNGNAFSRNDQWPITSVHEIRGKM